MSARMIISKGLKLITKPTHLKAYSTININPMNIMLSTRYTALNTNMNDPNDVKTSSSSTNTVKIGRKGETKPFPVVSTDNEDVETVSEHIRV